MGCIRVPSGHEISYLSVLARCSGVVESLDFIPGMNTKQTLKVQVFDCIMLMPYST